MFFTLSENFICSFLPTTPYCPSLFPFVKVTTILAPPSLLSIPSLLSPRIYFFSFLLKKAGHFAHQEKFLSWARGWEKLESPLNSKRSRYLLGLES